MLTVTLLLQALYVVLGVAKQQGVLGLHEFRIEEEGFREKTTVNDTLHAWPVIRSIHVGKDYSYVRTGAWSLHILPARSFPNRDAYADFLAALQKKWMENRG